MITIFSISCHVDFYKNNHLDLSHPNLIFYISHSKKSHSRFFLFSLLSTTSFPVMTLHQIIEIKQIFKILQKHLNLLINLNLLLMFITSVMIIKMKKAILMKQHILLVQKRKHVVKVVLKHKIYMQK